MKFTAGEGEVVTRSGRMGEVGYSKSQPQESKFDFRAIVGQQFFFSFLLLLEHLSLSPFPCFFTPCPIFATGRGERGRAARPEVAQTRQGSYLLEERVLRVTAGCSLFLDYCYAGMENWQRGRQRGWEEEKEWKSVYGGGGKKESEGNEIDGGGSKRERASQWKHREPCLPFSAK